MPQMLEINLRPDRKTLRQFGLIAVVGFGAIAAFAHYELFIFAMDLGAARPYVTYAFAALAVWSGLFALIYPKANLPVYLGLVVVTYPIGFVLSYVILGSIFFGLITPTGFIMRLIGRDPLERKFEPDSKTYWKDCRPPRDKSSYFKQF